MVGRDGEAPSSNDERIDYIKDLTLKTLRLKPDKVYFTYDCPLLERPLPILARLKDDLFLV